MGKKAKRAKEEEQCREEASKVVEEASQAKEEELCREEEARKVMVEQQKAMEEDLLETAVGRMAQRVVEEVARQDKSNKWCYNVNNIGLALHFIFVIPSGTKLYEGLSSATTTIQHLIIEIPRVPCMWPGCISVKI